MDDAARVSHYVDMWKQTIEVQKHFNDIEWRIRGLALTALTFALGAAAVAARDHTTVNLFGWKAQLSFTILVLGILLWCTFAFVDAIWYHRLLIGAVRHGEALEKELQKELPVTGLTLKISESSPTIMNFQIRNRSRQIRLHSSLKLRLFYMSGVVVMLIAAVALQIGT